MTDGTPIEKSEKPQPLSRRSGNVGLLLFAVLFVTFAYFFHGEPGWNVNSRISLTYALVEKRSFVIDDYQKIDELYTQDRALFEGHYYSDKIIGTSLLGAIPMIPLHLVSRAIGREFSWDVKRYVVRTFSVSVLGALAGVVLYGLLLRLGTGPAGALFLTLAFIFGTQIFSVCTVFLSYAPATCFALLSYDLLVRDRTTPGFGTIFLAGLALGASLLCEYTVGIVAVGLSVYALYHVERKPAILGYWLGAALPLSIFVVYTMICFGRPTIPYEYLENQEFKQGMSRGFQGIVGFNPTVLYYITIHRYRGLFYHSPFLVLAVWGWIAMWRDSRRRSDVVLSIAMVVGYLTFNASYYMWWGGWTNGPRHLIPALPFLIVPLVAVWRSGTIGRVLLVGLATVGLFLNTVPAWVDAQTPQNEPKGHLYNPRVVYNYPDPLWHSRDRLGGRELGIKAFFRGNVAGNAGQLLGLRQGWSLIPLVVFWCAAVALLMRFLHRANEQPRSDRPAVMDAS